MSTRVADDFDAIRERMRVIRGEIGIAGPAGNPTQPTGTATFGECGACKAARTQCTGACCCYC